MNSLIIAKYFDRDPETNQVLWFSAPPVDVARPKPAKHSLEYMYFLAKKRKRELEGDEGNGGEADEEADGAEPKRTTMAVQPTVTETMQRIAREMFPESH